MLYNKFKLIAGLGLTGVVLTGSSVFAALNENFTSNQTQASVSEVKASRTLTLNSAPTNGSSITISSCVVSFVQGAGTGDNSASTDDTNCNDNIAQINLYTLTNPGVARTTTELANVLDSLTNLSDSNHGALTVSADTATTTKFTTTNAETSNSDINFVDNTTGAISASNTVTGVVAQAQVVDFTPSSASASGVTYRATLNGSNYDYTSSGADSVSTITAALATSMNGAAGISCIDNSTKITCTADIAGTAYTYASAVVDLTAPSITSANSASVSENQTSALTVSASDADPVLTYSISGGNDQSKFSINSSTGVLSFNSSPDYENPSDANKDNIYEVQVKATDSSSNASIAQSINISIKNIYEGGPGKAGVSKKVTSYIPKESAPKKDNKTDKQAELKKRIQELLAEVARLKKILAEKNNTKENKCYLFKEHYKMGDRGDGVKSIQQFLKERGFFKANITGYFGPITKKAVMDFQDKYADDILKPLSLKKATGN